MVETGDDGTVGEALDGIPLGESPCVDADGWDWLAIGASGDVGIVADGVGAAVGVVVVADVEAAVTDVDAATATEVVVVDGAAVVVVVVVVG